LSTRVGFIGLGNMGIHMAGHVLDAGFELTVCNRTRSKAEGLAKRGARIAETAAEVARSADIVLACLASIPLSEEAFLGSDGALAEARPGQIFVDHATVAMATSKKVDAAAREREAHFLDAPISGGPGGAADASLSIMVGGDAAVFERALPVFKAMGKTILHMGPCGAGTATKLANQLLVGVHTVASCEALELARRAGVDLETLVAVLRESWGASRMLERNAPNILAEDFGPSPVPLRNLHKDLAIILALAAEQGIDLPGASRAQEVFQALMDEGKGECDITAATEKVRPTQG